MRLGFVRIIHNPHQNHTDANLCRSRTEIERRTVSGSYPEPRSVVAVVAFLLLTPLLSIDALTALNRGHQPLEGKHPC